MPFHSTFNSKQKHSPNISPTYPSLWSQLDCLPHFTITTSFLKIGIPIHIPPSMTINQIFCCSELFHFAKPLIAIEEVSKMRYTTIE